MVTLRKLSFSRVAGVLAVAGVVLSPVAVSAATTNQSTTINATVGSTISMTTSGTVTLNVTPVTGGAASSASDTVTVNTNSTGTMNLTLSNGDTTTNLASGANTIAAHAGTWAAPSALANNSWGYRIDNAGSFGAGPTSAQTNAASLSGTWAGVPSSASPQTIKSVTGPLTNDVTTVWYGVEADTTKPAGTYTDTVTYTATAP